MRTRKWIVAIVCVLLAGRLLPVDELIDRIAERRALLLTECSFACTEAGEQVRENAKSIPNRKDSNDGQKNASVRTGGEGCTAVSASSSKARRKVESINNVINTSYDLGTGIIPIDPFDPGSGVTPIGPQSWYTITLNENWEGGTGRIMENSSSYILPSASRPGETFYGWATTPDGLPIYAAGDTVSPSEDMILYAIWIHHEFFVEDGVLKVYEGTGGNIVIPTGVTAIGDNVFAGYTTITSITLPAGVTTIGNKAFSGCGKMTNINIPAGVTTIGDYAFRSCSSLTSITLPAEVTAIGAEAFNGCGSLTSITIPTGVTAIGDNAFRSCSSLTNITLPAGVTTIGNKAFSGCWKMTNINIPAGVTTIGDSAFYCCSSLTSITIPAGVTAIGDNAFDGCSSLTSITIPAGVTAIGDKAFAWCSSLTSITLPAGVTAIGNNAFDCCSSLTSITLPAGVTAIGDKTFLNCSSLTSITLPAGVTAIGQEVFGGCSSLASIFIPNTINEIGEFAFYDCPNLTIYAPAGSYAQRYAESNGYSFAIQHLSLKGTSVELSDIINLKLYYAIDDALLESGVYAHIIYADGTDELQEITDELRYTDANGDKSYIVNCRMAPKSIGDSISVQLCNESKSENYSSAFVYSVKQYCQDLLAEETCTDEEKTLIQAMLAYGTYSQLYFDYDSSALVIPESETEISSLEDVCDALAEIPETVSEGTLPEEITFYGSSLVLNSSIAYRMYFMAEDAENAETYGLVKSGTDGLYYIENETVSIAQVGDVLEYAVGDAVIRSCPLLYVKQVVNGAYSEELTNLCIAIYDYYKTAVRYAEGQR